MFFDPLRTFVVHPPPAWAYDPRTSTLTRLVFREWNDPRHVLSVCVFPYMSGVLPRGADPQWLTAVESILPSDVVRHGVHTGVLLNGRQAVVAETRDATRVAFLRGTVLTTSVEESGQAPGGSLLTPTMLGVIRALEVPADEGSTQKATENDWEDDWTSAMDAAASALRSGDAEAAVQHWQTALSVGAGAWTLSLRSEDPPDICPAVFAADTLLVIAEASGGPRTGARTLGDATQTLYRCLNSLPALVPPDAAIAGATDELINRALSLHLRAATDVRPSNVGEACVLRALRLLDELSSGVIVGSPDGSLPPGRAMSLESELATRAYDNAKTAMMLTNCVMGIPWEELSSAQRLVLESSGLHGEHAYAEHVAKDRIHVLELLASAGRAVALLQLGAVDVSAYAMRNDALNAARQLVELAPTEDHILTCVDVLSGCADALHELGDQASLSAARARLDEASRCVTQLNEPPLVRAQLEARIAFHHCLDLDVERGLQAAERAIKAAAAAGDPQIEAGARANRSELLNLAGRHEEALAEARRALSLASRDQRSQAHGRLALALHHAGHPVEARAEIRKGIAEEFNKNPVSGTMLRHLVAASRVLEARGRALSSRAADVAELLLDISRSDIGGVDERIALEDSLPHRRLTAALVDLRLSSGQLALALATTDRHRARSIAEQDGILQPRSGAPVSFSLPPARASLSTLIDAVEAAAHSAASSWGVRQPPDEAHLARLIADHGRTLVVFHPTDTRLLAFVVHPGTDPRVVVASESVDEVVRMTDALRQQLGIVVTARSARGRLPAQTLEATLHELGLDDEDLDDAEAELSVLLETMHDVLFAPLDDLLPDQAPVAVVPYRELSLVPLALLRRADGTSLADHHALSVLPSIASLDTLGIRQAEQPRAVIVGDPRLPPALGLAPLRWAAKEARDARELLEGAGVQTRFLPGRRATEAAFRSAASGATIVHLACHATVREPASESALFLTPSEGDDGQLFPDEVANLQLDGALVVLSACQSGVGRVTADGVIGLGRAFMRAGARSVLMSLWRVEDRATAFLMMEFYNGLVGSGADLGGRRLDVAGAARRAQLLTRDRLESRASAWGPWNLVGDGGWRLD